MGGTPNARLEIDDGHFEIDQGRLLEALSRGGASRLRRTIASRFRVKWPRSSKVIVGKETPKETPAVPLRYLRRRQDA